MKKLSLFVILLIGVIACNKTIDTAAPNDTAALKSDKPITIAEAAALGVYDEASEDVEEQLTFDDSPIVDLNTRSATVNISSVTTDTLSFVNDSNGYATKLCGKHRGLPKIYGESYFKIRGSGFGTSKGTTTVTMTLNSKTYTLSDFQALVSNGPTWTDTLLYVGMADILPTYERGFKYGNVKFTITKGTETVYKTIKAVGDWRDGNNTDSAFESAFCFGKSFWNIANERSKINKPSFDFTVTKTENAQAAKDGAYKRITPDYVPQVGDMVFRPHSLSRYNEVASGEGDWDPEFQPLNNAGVVMAVSPIINNVQTVTIWEMNLKCTSTLQKKKYKYLHGLFIPKTGEIPFFGYGR